MKLCKAVFSKVNVPSNIRGLICLLGNYPTFLMVSVRVYGFNPGAISVSGQITVGPWVKVFSENTIWDRGSTANIKVFFLIFQMVSLSVDGVNPGAISVSGQITVWHRRVKVEFSDNWLTTLPSFPTSFENFIKIKSRFSDIKCLIKVWNNYPHILTFANSFSIVSCEIFRCIF